MARPPRGREQPGYTLDLEILWLLCVIHSIWFGTPIWHAHLMSGSGFFDATSGRFGFNFGGVAPEDRWQRPGYVRDVEYRANTFMDAQNDLLEVPPISPSHGL